MALLNIDALSLMAFSTEDIVNQWREAVLEEERQKEQKLDITTHTDVAHTNMPHTDVAYRETAYREVAHTDVAHTNTPHTNVAYREAAYRKVAHTDVAHTDIPYRQSAYRQVAHTDVAHTNVAHRDVAARDSYSKVLSSNYRQYTDTTHNQYYYRYTQTYYTQGRTSYSQYYEARSYYNGRYIESYTRNYGQPNGYGKYTRAHRNSHNADGKTTGYYYQAYYTQYSQAVAASNYYYYQLSYSQRTASYTKYTEAYSANTYTRTAHSNTAYRQVPYSQRAHTNVAHVDTPYSEVAYKKVAHTDVAAVDVPHRNVAEQNIPYREVPHTNIAGEDSPYREIPYSQRAAVNYGFDHQNYIPSAPRLYEIEGKVISDTLEVRLASYDKNKDGHGSQDQNSLDIYYEVHLKRTHTLSGQAVTEEWKTLLDGKMTEDFDVSVSGYEDGIYQIKTTAYNLPRTENGVTKTYISDTNIYTFTIQDGELDGSIEIINAHEFYDYTYGNETYLTRDNSIRNYLQDVIYANAKEGQEKGLFLEFDVKSEDSGAYHKITAKLQKNGTDITSEYPIILEKDVNGDEIAGNKQGITFIPVTDMLDNGFYEDVSIILDIEVYKDKNLTQQIEKFEDVIGVDQASNAIFIDLDGENPSATFTPPSSKKVTVQNVNINYTDVGKGVGKSYYQVVNAGDSPKEDKWIEANGISSTVTLNMEGKYDIYAKVIDKVGNESILSEKNYVISGAIISLVVPEAGTIGTNVVPVGSVLTDMGITQTRFWIQDYTDPVIGTYLSTEDKGEKDLTKYMTQFYLNESIPEGVHVVFFEVTLEDGTVKKTSQTMIVTKKVIGIRDSWGIYHTDKWKSNLDHYNSKVSNANKRAESMFWAGEKFVIRGEYTFANNLGLDVRNLIQEVEVTSHKAKDGSSYKYSFANYIANEEYKNDLVATSNGYKLVQEAFIWNEDMINRWGQGTHNLVFKFTFVDGSTQEVTIQVNDVQDFYKLHRKF